MFAEFPTACLFCKASFLVSCQLPEAATTVPDGAYFDCTCPKCGEARTGMVPNFEPISLVAVRSSDSIEGRLTDLPG
jgi:hypothetical protein